MPILLIDLLATACNQWAGVGYGPARTSYNPAENQLDVAEVTELAESWSATVPPGLEQPIIADGRVFLASGALRAYDLEPGAGCTGVPTTCEPIWQSSAGGFTAVTVADDVAYAVGGGSLHAYDATGQTGCSGTPVTCAPLWTASVGSGGAWPAVTHDTVYVTGDRLYAFDAAGTTGCSGAPTTCQPLWQSSTTARGGAAVSDGVAYVITDQDVAAFDAFGVQGCSGAPITCEPLRTYSVADQCFPYGCVPGGPPTVSQGRLFVLASFCCSMATGGVALLMFDSTGVVGCAGAPLTCSPNDTASVPSSGLPYFKAPVAVANGVVYATSLGVSAFDAATLDRLWTGPSAISSPSVADGVLHTLDAVSSGGGFMLEVQASDAAGAVGCSGVPVVCDQVWTSPTGAFIDPFVALQNPIHGPAVATGHLAVRTGRLQVFDRS